MPLFTAVGEVKTVAAVSSRPPCRQSVDVGLTIDLAPRKTKFTVVQNSPFVRACVRVYTW